MKAWLVEFRRYWREALLGFILLLPFIALPVLGYIWLTQQGLLYYWFISLLAVVTLLMTVRAFWQPRPHDVTIQQPDPGATPAEKKARDELQKLADQVSAVNLDSAENVKQLLVCVIDVVACAYSPNDGTAIPNFTIPEALLMSEDVSQRLRASIVKDIPMLRHVNIKCAIKGQEAIKPVKHIWNIWRVIRLSNPVTASIQEARSFILNKVLRGFLWSRTQGCTI